MATVITLCGIAAVGFAMITRRAQKKRDALMPHTDLRI
jgi:DHA1 family bicyclomycin/chloramphenicol resistance-like MFS transporter